MFCKNRTVRVSDLLYLQKNKCMLFYHQCCHESSILLISSSLSAHRYISTAQNHQEEDHPLVPVWCDGFPRSLYLSASMTMLTCSLEACWVTAAGHPGDAVCVGSWPGVHRPWCPRVAGGLIAQLTWGAGDVAIEAIGLPLPKLSEALRRENMARASGKLGGVAGVFAGVHIWWRKRET